jgi:hypothetical protein
MLETITAKMRIGFEVQGFIFEKRFWGDVWRTQNYYLYEQWEHQNEKKKKKFDR